MSGNIATLFFNYPLLRLGNPNGLNDPFEFSLTEAHSNEISAQLDASGSRENGFREYMNQFKSHGIISISETYDNLLMWSHYSDEHRGAVFEFDIDELEPYLLFTHKKTENNNDFDFGKINYRKMRKHQNENLSNDLPSVRKHYIFIKSDEWIYEKEYRYVMHYSDADIVKVKMEACKKAFETNDLNFSSFIIEDGVALDDDGINLWINLHTSNLPKNILQQMWVMTSIMGSFFFKKINFKYVTKFIMGCRYAYDIDNTIKTLADKSISEKFLHQNEFKNILIATPHKERFELEFEDYRGRFFSYFS